MRPDEGDAAYLWDMLQAAELASEFVCGVSYLARFCAPISLQA